MSSFLPRDSGFILALAAILAGIFLGGFRLTRFRKLRLARLLGWMMFSSAVLGVERLAAAEPPGVRMVALIFAALFALKAIVVLEERLRGLAALRFSQWSGFTIGWLGMQPGLFAAPRSPSLPGIGNLLWRGIASITIGAALLLLARWTWITSQSRFAPTALALPGLSLLLHFGILNVLAASWRYAGVRCDALFRAPWRSVNLTEFWSRRWNLAFSEMTAIAVYRPLAARCGRGPALIAGFAFSGLLHEMAISGPVQNGYGLPLAYFLLHGGLVLFEGMQAKRGRSLEGWPGRIWTLFWLIGPLPLLFHPPFLSGIIWPLIGIN